MRMMSSRRLLPWLFALTLLFGQVAAFAHTLTHLHEHDGALPDTSCKVCIAHAQLGSAAPPSVALPALPPAGNLTPGVAPAICTDLAPRSACARAPPTPFHA